MYDVSARIVDLQEMARLPLGPVTWDAVRATEKFISMGNIAANTVNMLGPFPLPSTDSKDFNVFISARNGMVTEYMRFRRVNTTWRLAIRVMRGDSVLHEYIDPGFPKSPDGSVKW